MPSRVALWLQWMAGEARQQLNGRLVCQKAIVAVTAVTLVVAASRCVTHGPSDEPKTQSILECAEFIRQ